jgi:Flp pilus assembly protein TadG
MSGRLASRIGRSLLPRRRRGFARDESGVTAVEFGLLAGPFFAILGAILETSMVFLSGQILDSAVQDVSRLIRTGQAQQTGMSAEQFKQGICNRLYGLFNNCAGLHVEVQVIDSFNTASISPPVNLSCEDEDGENGCNDWTRPESYAPGQGSSIVMVQVYYQWPLILAIKGLGLTNLADGKHLMGAAAVFRNEPFT